MADRLDGEHSYASSDITEEEHSNAAASFNGFSGISNLVALQQLHPFLSSINPINQSQLTVNLSRSTAPLNPAPQPVVFNYTVKIQNPASDIGTAKFVVRQVHDFHSRFTGLNDLKAKVCSLFTDDIPSVGEMGHIGYFEGRQKRWLCDERDLVAMYDKFKGTSVTIPLWSDRVQMAAAKDNSATKRPPTKRERNEEEVDDIFTELRKKHKDFETPKLRLWARMIANGIHESTDEPPNVPMISGIPPKQPKWASVHDAVIDAAKAVAEVLTESRKKDDQSPKASTHRTLNGSVSPFRLAEVRMKHYEQLCYLQTLLDDGILSDAEFLEQKSSILDALRNL